MSVEIARQAVSPGPPTPLGGLAARRRPHAASPSHRARTTQSRNRHTVRGGRSCSLKNLLQPLRCLPLEMSRVESTKSPTLTYTGTCPIVPSSFQRCGGRHIHAHGKHVSPQRGWTEGPSLLWHWSARLFLRFTVFSLFLRRGLRGSLPAGTLRGTVLNGQWHLTAGAVEDES